MNTRDIIRPFVPQFILNEWKRRREKRELNEWYKIGCPVPPPHLIKQITIGEYQQKYNYTTLVETGTFMGAMVEAQKTRFKRIISIELAVDLYDKAKKRFSETKNVLIVQGDSGKVLPKILKGIREPLIFWLDGHYSAGMTAKGDKDCPIFEELDAIFNGTKLNHVLLIDDARCFVGGDYPTIAKLTEYILGKNEKYKVEVKNDIIRYVI
jgi:hypothetical protein